MKRVFRICPLLLFALLLASSAGAGVFGNLEGFWLSVDPFPGYRKPALLTVGADAIKVNKRRVPVTHVKRSGSGYSFQPAELQELLPQARPELDHRLEGGGDALVWDYPNAVGKRGRIRFKRVEAAEAREFLR